MLTKTCPKSSETFGTRLAYCPGMGIMVKRPRRCMSTYHQRYGQKSDFEYTIKLTKSNLLERNIYNAFNYLSVFFNWHRIFYRLNSIKLVNEPVTKIYHI